MVQKFMGMADQLDNIGFEGDEVREELILRSEVLSTK